MSRRRESPPKLARAILDWLLPPDDAGAATGDLDEEYARFVRPAKGRVRADLWYWRQVLLSLPRLAARRRGSAFGPAGSLFGDIRIGLRVLRRRPGFTVAAVATLALGLGATTAVFSVVNTVLMRPLPFSEPGRLVRPVPDEIAFMGSGEVQPFSERMTTLSEYAAWGRSLFLFTNGGEAEEVRGARVSWNHFDMLGIDPLLGRTFARSDAESDDTILLSHGLWIRRFGGDPGVIGTTVSMYGRNLTVIGVLRPEHVPIEYDWEAWRTLPLDPELAANMGLAGNGRLREGATLVQMREELRRVLPEIWAEGGYYASDEERSGLEVEPLRTWLLGDAAQSLSVLAGAVGFILLLACANVINLLIAQTSGRYREFALRAALGGTRSRLTRQLLVEVGLVSGMGGLAALGAASASLGWFAAQLPPDLPRASDVSMSGSVVLFTALGTLVAALAIGVVPALRSSREGVGGLSRAGRGSSSGRERVRWRSVLVMSEMALAVVLVVGAGLMLRSLASLQGVDPGFDPQGVVTVRPSPPSDRYPEGPALDAYYDELTGELGRLPGVRSVGAIQFLPMTPGGWWTSYRPEGLAIADGENAPNTAMRVVLPGYFETMGIPVLEGRALVESDAGGESQPVAVVNETLAAEAFPGGDAVGRTVEVDGTDLLVVGIVRDVRQSDLRTSSHPEMYVGFGQVPWRRMHIVVRAEGDERSMLAAVSGVVRSLDGEVSMLGPRRMREVVGSTIGDARLVTALLTVFGLIGLGLGAIGVYGVAAQTVGEQRREIGIRIALGAKANGVASSTVLRGLVPVGLGVALGLLLAFTARGTLDGLLFGVGSADPGTFVTAPIVLVMVALASIAVPAVRASRLDPMRTLSEE